MPETTPNGIKLADLQAQLRTAHSRLGFGDRLEHHFRRYNSERSMLVIRTTFTLALIMLVLFAIFDAHTYGRIYDLSVALPLFGVYAASTVVCVLATFITRLRQRLMRLLPYFLLINGLALAVALARATEIGMPSPFEVMMLQLIYVFFLSGLTFAATLMPALVVSVFYLGMEWRASQSLVILSEHTGFLLFLLVVGSVGAYLIERTQRRNWLQSQLLGILARQDELTGLHNRRHLLEQAQRLITEASARQQPMALLMVDLDHFKWLNDTLGHLAGDDTLRQVGVQLALARHGPQDIAARFGGEEFTLIFPGVELAEAQARAETLRRDIETLRLPHPAAPSGHVTCSIGCTTLPAGVSSSLDALIAAADAALYEAKDKGRNQVCARELSAPRANAPRPRTAIS